MTQIYENSHVDVNRIVYVRKFYYLGTSYFMCVCVCAFFMFNSIIIFHTYLCIFKKLEIYFKDCRRRYRPDLLLLQVPHMSLYRKKST